MLNLQTKLQENPPCALNKDTTPNILSTSHLTLDNFLTDKECELIVEYVNSNYVLSPGLNRDNRMTSNRNSSIAFVEPSDGINWLYEKILNKIVPINNKYQKFDLTHLDRFQYVTYSEGQYLEHHTDDYFDYLQINGESRDLLLRKLSVSIGLNSEYEGGDFEIQNFKGSVEEPYSISKLRLNKGSAIIFPSFQLHKVHEITKGTRKAIVAWFFGPKWR